MSERNERDGWRASLARCVALSDMDLVARVRDDDHAAFEELFRRHFATARRAAVSVVGQRDASDVASSAMLAMFRAIRNGLGPTRGSVGGYLVHAVRTAAQDPSRLRWCEHEVMTNMLPESPSSSGDDPGDEIDRADLEVRAALAALPERWSFLLVELEVNGQPLGHVASSLGLSLNAAAALSMRARRGLRRELERAWQGAGERILVH